jgi:hypothetical protein
MPGQRKTKCLPGQAPPIKQMKNKWKEEIKKLNEKLAKEKQKDDQMNLGLDKSAPSDQPGKPKPHSTAWTTSKNGS